MNEKILIIEDDKDVSINLETLLFEEGYTVFTAVDGVDGINKVKELKPDLIICDIQMPKMTGFEVIKTLSFLDEISTIPFLFLSARVEASDIRDGMRLGADDYLLKPFDTDELLETIKNRLLKVAKLQGKYKKEVEENSTEKKKYSENDNIFFTIKDKPQFVKINTIVYIQAERQYIILFLDDKSKITMRKSLSYWEKILPENLFLRVHRSTIINLNYIVKLEKWFSNSYKIFLKNNFGEIMMSSRFASKLKSHNL